MPGSSIGEMFKVTTFGESHGPALGCVETGVHLDWFLTKLTYS